MLRLVNGSAWIGFELNHIIKLANPTYKAKYISFESVYDPENLPGQKRNTLAWPYREGLRLDGLEIH